MAITCQVKIVRENAGFNVTRNAQHTVLLESQEGFLIAPADFASDSIVEVDLELRPPRFYIESIDFFAEGLSVLVALLQMVRGQTN